MSYYSFDMLLLQARIARRNCSTCQIIKANLPSFKFQYFYRIYLQKPFKTKWSWLVELRIEIWTIKDLYVFILKLPANHSKNTIFQKNVQTFPSIVSRTSKDRTTNFLTFLTLTNCLCEYFCGNFVDLHLDTVTKLFKKYNNSTKNA